jgi:hypothetical protein
VQLSKKEIIMSLNVPSYSGDPTSATPITNAYAAVISFSFSSLTQTIAFSVGFFRSQADYEAGKTPMNSRGYSISSNPVTRQDGTIIPSYSQVMGQAVTLSSDPAGTLAFSIVSRTVFGFLLSLPEFAGATVVS